MEKVTLTYASMKRFSYPNLMSNFFGSNHAERIPAYATICVNLIHEVFFSSRDIKQLKEVNHTTTARTGTVEFLPLEGIENI